MHRTGAPRSAELEANHAELRHVPTFGRKRARLLKAVGGAVTAPLQERPSAGGWLTGQTTCSASVSRKATGGLDGSSGTGAPAGGAFPGVPANSAAHFGAWHFPFV